MTKRALLIGINYEYTANELNGCINDVINVRQVLIEKYQYLPENIIVLRDDSSDIQLKPTRRNILANLRQLVSLSPNSSEIWLHYSGHGSRIRDTNGDEKGGKDSVIIPTDYATAGIISDDKLLNIIQSSSCPTIAIFDSCNSGTICDLQWSFPCKIRKNNKIQFRRIQNTNKPVSNPFLFTLSASRDYQTSDDAYNLQTQSYGGAFTDALLQCMKKLNYNGNIFKLYSRTCKLLKKQRFLQKPLLSCSSASPRFIFTGTNRTISRNYQLLPKLSSMMFL